MGGLIHRLMHRHFPNRPFADRRGHNPDYRRQGCAFIPVEIDVQVLQALENRYQRNHESDKKQIIRCTSDCAFERLV